jgi:hypothetical protein
MRPSGRGRRDGCCVRHAVTSAARAPSQLSARFFGTRRGHFDAGMGPRDSEGVAPGRLAGQDDLAVGRVLTEASTASRVAR